MDNKQKAEIYEDLLRESDRLQRANSKLKSEYVVNIPAHIQQQINENNRQIGLLVKKLEDLLR